MKAYNIWQKFGNVIEIEYFILNVHIFLCWAKECNVVDLQ